MAEKQDICFQSYIYDSLNIKRYGDTSFYSSFFKSSPLGLLFFVISILS